MACASTRAPSNARANPTQAPAGVPVAEAHRGHPMLFQPLHLLPLPSSSSSPLRKPGAGMGSPPLPHAGSRAESRRLWPGSRAPSTGGEQSHRRARSLPPFHPAPGKVQSPGMLPPPPWSLSPSLPLAPRRAREGGEREVPRVPENSTRLQKEDVKIIKHR